jgi:heme-degrading monooxygenase HmoA
VRQAIAVLGGDNGLAAAFFPGHTECIGRYYAGKWLDGVLESSPDGPRSIPFPEQKTGIEGYQRTPGNRGAWLLWRVEGDHAEFITVSFWESRAAIEAFAGQDIEKAVFYPDDEQFLIERDLTVHHYEVAATE